MAAPLNAAWGSEEILSDLTRCAGTPSSAGNARKMLGNQFPDSAYSVRDFVRGSSRRRYWYARSVLWLPVLLFISSVICFHGFPSKRIRRISSRSLSRRGLPPRFEARGVLPLFCGRGASAAPSLEYSSGR